MFLALSDTTFTTNQQPAPSSVDWCPQTHLGGPGTYLTLEDILGIDIPEQINNPIDPPTNLL